eukprot:1879443-Pyramimonas_sp.AAC.1
MCPIGVPRGSRRELSTALLMQLARPSGIFLLWWGESEGVAGPHRAVWRHTRTPPCRCTRKLVSDPQPVCTHTPSVTLRRRNRRSGVPSWFVTGEIDGQESLVGVLGKKVHNDEAEGWWRKVGLGFPLATTVTMY